jgi:hypothetical protein
LDLVHAYTRTCDIWASRPYSYQIHTCALTSTLIFTAPTLSIILNNVYIVIHFI